MSILLANSFYLGGKGFTLTITINSIHHITGDIKIIVGNLTLSLASRIPALRTYCSPRSWVRGRCKNVCGTTHNCSIISGWGLGGMSFQTNYSARTEKGPARRQGWLPGCSTEIN